ncbi:MAG: sigma-E factor negative regulatory protein [Parahaliea sp.]
MTEHLRESLSAMMDGEANELELERVLRQVGEDTELRRTWVRYHAVRTACQGQPLTPCTIDISGGVREAIAKETWVLPRISRWQHLLRPVGSLAVAASVAAAVIVGGQQISLPGNVAGTPEEAAVTGGVSPVGMVNSFGATSVRASYGTQSVPVLQPATRTAYHELARQRMMQYSQDHAEQAALNTPQGLLPFARVQQIRE